MLYFFIVLAFYFLGEFSLEIYFTQRFYSSIEKHDFKKLQELRKEFRENRFLLHLYPIICHSFLRQIEQARSYFHERTENDIGCTLDFLLLEAKDEYENLNGLTSSEDEEEEYA